MRVQYLYPPDLKLIGIEKSKIKYHDGSKTRENCEENSKITFDLRFVHTFSCIKQSD